MKEIKVFCTGGWDSTFMLCRFSQKPLTITPIYVINPKRLSRNTELKALKQIINSLIKHPKTKAQFKEPILIDLSKTPINPDIIAARKRLSGSDKVLGYQYEYLASIADDLGMVGLGVEKAPKEVSGANITLNRFAKLVKTTHGYVVDQRQSSPDVNAVFGHMFFPIMDITEQEMLKWVKENGYTEVMKQIWFCHSPIKGQPCGLCRPCEEKMNSNMGFLLPQKAQSRYYSAKKWDIFGQKISHKLKNIKRRFICDTTD